MGEEDRPAELLPARNLAARHCTVAQGHVSQPSTREEGKSHEPSHGASRAYFPNIHPSFGGDIVWDLLATGLSLQMHEVFYPYLCFTYLYINTLVLLF